MNAKKLLILSVLILSLIIFSVYAQVTVGLNEGDWVEYEGSYTGNPPDSYSQSAKLEIQNIQGTMITIKINALHLNGTQTSRTETFDLETGAPDAIIIPANLETGNEIYNEELGTLTIEGEFEYNFNGITRKLLYANIGDQLEFTWDKKTGIFVEINQITDTFTQNLILVDTNIVQAQTSELDPLILYGAIIAVVIIIIILAILLLKRKK